MKFTGLFVAALLVASSALAAPQKKAAVAKASPVATTPDPAMEALRSFSSTLDVGVNQRQFADALVALKIKVDASPRHALYDGVVQLFVDANHLWNVEITNTENFPVSYAAPYLEKYPAQWAEVAADWATANTTYNAIHGTSMQAGTIVWHTHASTTVDRYGHTTTYGMEGDVTRGVFVYGLATKLIKQGQQQIKDMKP